MFKKEQTYDVGTRKWFELSDLRREWTKKKIYRREKQKDNVHIRREKKAQWYDIMLSHKTLCYLML